MVKDDDHPGRSAQAIHIMWTSISKGATFPAIPEDLGPHQYPEFINKWLFATGYLDSQQYRSTYENCAEISLDKARAFLHEIFCNVESPT